MNYTQSELSNLINQEIKSLKYSDSPYGLYAPIEYVLSLGGKRIRPLMMLLAYNLYKDDVKTIIPQALALEVYHNFTLLHDDLMDKAEVRRGNPCVHKKWDDNTAILSGDAMLILAYRLMTENRTVDQVEYHPSTINSQYLNKALVTFNSATLGVCDGQQFDIEFETRMDVTEAEYMEMIRLKTSLLLACALKIGAQLAGAPTADANHLYNIGEKIGLAFQLQDDLLDVYGDFETFGKKPGGDILCNKKTFLLINALNLANPEQKKQLTEWINKEIFVAEEKINAVRKLYDEIEVREICERRINELFAEAQEELQAVAVEEQKKSELRALFTKLMGRKF